MNHAITAPVPTGLALVPSPPEPAAPTFGAAEAALLDEALLHYRYARLAKSQAEKTIAGDARLTHTVSRLLNLPPWAWLEEHVRVIGAHYSTRAYSTQRRYVCSLRGMLDFCSGDAATSQLIYERTGRRPRQVFHRHLTVTHRLFREVKVPRRGLTPDELLQLFAWYDQAILDAERRGCKSLRALERDKALFYLIYGAGLRAAEALSITPHSFSPAADRPEMGPFGRVHVLGKGRKFRVVELILPPLAKILRAYLEEVRPALARTGAPSDRLFLSERGGPLSYPALSERFRSAIQGAGLAGRHLSPHCLRHSFASHLVESRLPMTVVQRLLGHTFLATTQTYTHCPDDYQRETLRAMYDRAVRLGLPGGGHV